MSIRYGAWHIDHNPPPIPFRNCDWQFWHDDYDGAEDACDDRCGTAASLVDAMVAIDEKAADEWEKRGCSRCNACDPWQCMAAAPCYHRGDFLERRHLLTAEMERRATTLKEK
jgi:hypothetical protein